MWMILFVLSIAAILYGTMIMGIAQSAIHEIEAFILFLVGAVLLSGGTIVKAVNTVHTKLAAVLKQPKM